MGNDRLRAALLRAGLEVEDLAAKAQVDAKTVGRWLGGRTPHARYRTKVAAILTADEHDLWPDTGEATRLPDDRRELVGVFAHSNDLRVPDWRTLLQEAREQIELLDYSLIDIVSSPGVIETLAEKAAGGCQIRILIAHPKSIWVSSAAQQLGQDQPDHEGNSQLDLEIDRARGHLEALTTHPGIGLRTHWAERTNTVLRFDDQMLVTLHLYATPGSQAPLLHIHRRGDDGLFEQFAAHLDAIDHEASEPIEPDPDLYPPPSQNPERYQPVTEAIHEERRRQAQERSKREIAAARSTKA
jgi:transcriptional regulator with XRE-family HTH domain